MSSRAVPALRTTEAAPPSPVQAWFSVTILLIFSLVSILDRQILALMVDPIKKDLNLSDTQFGLLHGFAFVAFYSLAGIPIGWAVDRYPRRLILFLGITFWSLSAAFCGLTRSFWGLFIGRSAVGVGEATLSPAAVSLISDLFPPNRVATPFGVYSAGFYIGSGIALGIGGLLVSFFMSRPPVHLPLFGEMQPWQMVFLVAGLPGVAVAFLAWLIHDPRRHRPVSMSKEEKQKDGFIEHFRTRGRVTFHVFTGFSAAAVISYVIPAWTPTFFMRRFGWEAQDIGWTFGMVVAGSGAIGALFGGVLLSRIFSAGRTDAYLLVPGIAGLLSAPALAGAYFVPDPVMALGCLAVGMTIFGVASAAVYPSFQRIAAPGLRGRLTAAYILYGALVGGGGGPLIVALITDQILQDEKMVGVSVAVTAGLALLLMSLAFLTGRKSMRDLPV